MKGFKRLEYQVARETCFEYNIGEGAFLELIRESADAFFFVDSEVRMNHKRTFNSLPHHVVAGGEIEKSVGTALELYPIAIETSRKSNTFIAVGGGTVIDIVGYVVNTVTPRKKLILAPTTLASMVQGFFSDRFYLNYDWKKDQVSVPGSPALVVVDPLFVETESSPNRTFGWLIALCNAVSYDPNLFDYLSKNLFKVDLTDLIWSILKHRAKNIEKGFPAIGETLANYVLEASGLRLSYPVAYAFAAIMELEFSLKTGFLSMKDYLRVREVLSKFRPERRIAIDFSHVIERLAEKGSEVRLSVLQGIGKITTMVIESSLLRQYMRNALERGLSLIG